MIELYFYVHLPNVLIYYSSELVKEILYGKILLLFSNIYCLLILYRNNFNLIKINNLLKMLYFNTSLIIKSLNVN